MVSFSTIFHRVSNKHYAVQEGGSHVSMPSKTWLGSGQILIETATHSCLVRIVDKVYIRADAFKVECINSVIFTQISYVLGA